MVFGVRLRELRKKKALTQKQLGKIIGVSDRVVAYYEANDRFPKDEFVLENIANYFDVSVDYLIGRSDIETPMKELDLSRDEIELVKLFRQLDEKEQQRYIGRLQELVEKNH